MFVAYSETEEGFVKVCSQRPIMIDQTVHRDVDLDDVIQPSVMITRFTQLKHFVKACMLIYLARSANLPEWLYARLCHAFLVYYLLQQPAT